MKILAWNRLLTDPKTNQKRVFYSLRHTYATLALTHDMVPIHTLAKQMGSSKIPVVSKTKDRETTSFKSLNLLTHLLTHRR